MAVNSKNKTPSNSTIKADMRSVDIYFERYNQTHQHPTNKILQWVSIPLMLFSLFGLLWAIPFPQLQFLGSFNGYFNWASFLISFAVYFYSRLSPMLSYITLIVLLGFSYGVMELQGWQNAGGPALWLVCAIILVLAGIAQVTGIKTEGRQSSLKDNILFLLISPIWLLHFILKKFSIKY